MTTRALQAVMDRPWAIYRPALQTIREIAGRMPVDPANVEAWKVRARAVRAAAGEPMRGAHLATMRDGVAILPLFGPIFPRANMMTEMSGATSLALFAEDLRRARDDDGVRAVLIDVDSPGGVASGVSEAAAMVRAAAAVKPVVAYAGGMAASAAYWIAAAAGELVAERTALVGCIGVVQDWPDQVEPDQQGVMWLEITSDNAPDKRPDPNSEAGMAVIKAELNALEAEFIAAVAAYRGVAADTVKTYFGRGGVLIAADAVAVGMADRLGTFEEVLAGLSGESAAARGGSLRQPKGSAMTEKKPAPAAETQPVTVESVRADHPEVAEALRAEGHAAGLAEGRASGLDEGRSIGAAAARERISAILTHAEAGGRAALARHLAFATDDPVDKAAATLAASPKESADGAAGAAYLAAAAADEAAVKAAELGPSVDGGSRVIDMQTAKAAKGRARYGAMFDAAVAEGHLKVNKPA